MEVVKGGVVEKTYPVSTSRYGLGTEAGSWKTPTGRFVICAKIGEGAPVGAVFKSRAATGEIAEQGGEEDKILTRILWLDGVEEENANSRERYIYIHGTNQEHLIGTRCVASPIYDEHAEVLGAISLAGPVSRLPDSRIKQLGPVVAHIAEEITRTLGGRWPHPH